MSTADSVKTPSRLLSPHDPPAVVVTNAGAACPILIIGDHAGRDIPRELRDLGLPETELSRHIAWDIGVAALGLRLARRLTACFIRQSYARLVIDCNRVPGSSGSIPLISDGIRIPGNEGLSDRQRRARLEEIYRPYQDRIGAELDQRQAAGASTVLLALHSFTPVLQRLARPWRYGVLHRGDSPFSTRILAVMTAVLGADVGDNQPYAMDEFDNTVPLHAANRPIDYLELEVRQDLIGDEAGQVRVAEEIAGFLDLAATGAARAPGA